MWAWECLVLPVVLTGVVAINYPSSPSPHIIYILADDMGWNDVSFHGSDQIPTPNIDSLGYHGVILNRHYVQPLCTPSRAALMTGKYPLHIGIHDALCPSHRVGLPLNEKILPQYLKDIGYSTHLVGKWHLGFYKKEFCPLERGFDSHFGYWSGAISYYDHIDEDPETVSPNKYPFSGHDMRRNYTLAWDVVGQYATDLFTREAVNVIENHSPDKPLFLYLAHLATHAGNQGKWLEAPQEEIDRFSYIRDPNRRTYAAIVSKLDQSIGAVIEALDRKNMLHNSIIVFVSDNGGVPNLDQYPNWASNYPFKGEKTFLWEGGVRTPALIWSPLIEKSSRVSYELMHMTDWLPTLLSAAGSNEKLIDIDGMDQWPTITKGQSSPREDLVVDINEELEMYSLISNHYKYLKGPLPPGTDTVENTVLKVEMTISPKAPQYSNEEIKESPTWKAVEKYSADSCLQYKVKGLREEAKVDCHLESNKVLNCSAQPCLFDLQNDPCEQINIADQSPAILNHMEELLDLYRMGAVNNLDLIPDITSNPDLFGGAWSIWES